jgi:hypothetical protein
VRSRYNERPVLVYFVGWMVTWIYFGTLRWNGEGTLLYKIIYIAFIDNFIACAWPITFPVSLLLRNIP